MFSSPEEVLKYIADEGVEFVDVRFIDLPGIMQHFTMPAAAFDASAFEDGQMFDGSSIRGFQAIHESDMKLIPDPATAYIDPYRAAKTLVVTHSIVDPFTSEPYSRDPRQVAVEGRGVPQGHRHRRHRATSGPRPSSTSSTTCASRPSRTPATTRSTPSRRSGTPRARRRAATAATRRGYKSGYFPVSPTDHQADLRNEMMQTLQQVGLELERGHHEVGAAGQAEINYKFNTLLHAGDDLMKFKYVIKNTAWKHGKTATFMPKPVFGDNGSGMHAHQSLWKDGEPLFYDEAGYGGLSDMARWYIGGLLAHAPAVLAFTNPTVNSYHRLVPGFEAPVNLVYSARNRSAAIRIPITGNSPKAKRIEFRAPDPSSNPYLAFSAMLMAGLDGIKNRIEPPAPVDKDLYELPPEEHANIRRSRPRCPRSSRPSRPTTTSSPRATCSRPTSSRRGSTGRRRTRSCRSRAGRTRTSSSCTTTSDPGARSRSR